MIRKILVLTFALFALTVAAAQAHNASLYATCGTASFGWTQFDDSGSHNNGLNQPHWSLTFTPTLGSATSKSGQVSFSGTTYYLDVSIPAVNGTLAMSSTWSASETRDQNSGGGSRTVAITNCSKQTPALTTAASPSSAPVGSSVTDVAHLTGGYSPTGTITWALYGPGDSTCSSKTPLTTSAVTVNGDGDYTSPALTPTTAGTYHWVASYSGDTNNTGLGPVGCSDPSETVTITPVSPALSTTATPASAGVGTPIRDVAHLTGGDHPTGTIAWALYGPNDSTCSAAGAPTTAPVSVTGAGDYTSPTLTPTQAGTYHWVATYSGDANNTALGPVGCTDPAESVSITPGPAPSFTMVKLEAVDGSNTPFVRGPITAQIGQQIDYEIQVTNTGNQPLALSLADVKCTNIRGPVGNLDSSGDLQVGGRVTYTCSHVVVVADAPQYVNSGTITATPPGSPPLPPQTSSVIANIPQQGVLCFATTSQLHLKTSMAHHVFTASLKVPGPAGTVRSVVFTVDGRTLAILGRPNGPNGTFIARVTVRRTGFRRHSVAAHVTFTCGPAKVASAGFRSQAVKVTPHFTG